MYKNMKYKLLILCSLICVYIFFPSQLYAMSQKEIGEAIATFALNFQKAPDGGQTWTYDWDAYARSQAYHGKKMGDGTYHADCVGWVSMCLHQSIGLDAPNVSDGSCGFVVPTIYSQNYSGFGSVIVDVTGQQLMPGDILQNSHHVMIYVGNIGGEDRIVHSVGSPLNYDTFSSYASWNESASVDIAGVYQHAYRISEQHASTVDKSQVKTTWNGSNGDYEFGEGSSGSGSGDSSGSSGGTGLENFEGNPNYQVQADDKKKNFRIVSINDKLPIYKHILLTEKYNFNKIKWKMYGHGNEAGKNSPMQSDITLGLKYPKDDSNTKLGKFVSLVLPYIQTWYIPLSMYSGILNAESGNMVFDSEDIDDSSSGGGSSSGNMGGTADYSGNGNQEIVWNFLKSKGFSDILAGSIMGTIHQESGFDTGVYNYEGSGAFGLCQWLGSRKTNLDTFAASQGKDITDITVQLDFLWYELSGENPAMGMGWLDPSEWTTFLSITTLYEATDYFVRHFERCSPGEAVIQTRVDAGQQYIQQFAGSTGSSDSSNSSDNSGTSDNTSDSDNNDDDSGDSGTESELKTSKAKKNVNFPYAIIKNGYYEITVNRYDIQKYTMNTKYRDYIQYTKKSEAVVKETTIKTVNDKGEETSSSTHVIVVSCNPDIEISQTPVNTRLDASGAVDPMKEEFVGASTSTSTKYYLQKALTFDMVYRNEFVFTKYNDADVQARRNPKSEMISGRSPYNEIIGGNTKLDAGTLSGSGSVANITSSYGASATQIDVSTSSTKNLSSVTRTYKLDGAAYTENVGEEIYIKREWEDKLTQASSENKQLDYDEMLRYNQNEDNDKKRDTISKEDFEGAPKKEYRRYKVMSKKGNLNLIDFINANPKIYKNYLNRGMEASKYMGYIKEDDLLMSYDQLKKLINKTRDSSGAVPYAYFVSLGFKLGYSNAGSIENNASSRSSGFGWPVDLNGNDGARVINCVFPYSPAYGEAHGAIDINPGEGANIIIAAKDGKILRVEDTASSGGYGNSVVIEHSDGYYTRYSHMSSIDSTIAEGIEVKKGQKLGIMGTTGKSTGVHLDFTIYQGGTSHSNRVDPLDFYVTEPEYGSIDPNSITSIPSGYVFKSEKRGGSGEGFSVVGTKLSKEEWTQKALGYAASAGGDACFQDKATMEKFYDTCTGKGVNPEYAFATAVCEQGLHSSVNNYWGLATPNGASSAYFGDMLTTLSAYCDLIVQYQDPSSSYYASIMAKYEERKAVTENGGADPNGYGTPDTIQGIQSIYSYLGKHEQGSSGAGGFYYMDPAVAGVTKVYSTHEEFVEKCRNGGAAHALGTETTPWEQAGYTAWQAEKKIDVAKSIFGDVAGTY